jgi:hypothetical protein
MAGRREVYAALVAVSLPARTKGLWYNQGLFCLQEFVKQIMKRREVYTERSRSESPRQHKWTLVYLRSFLFMSICKTDSEETRSLY